MKHLFFFILFCFSFLFAKNIYSEFYKSEEFFLSSSLRFTLKEQPVVKNSIEVFQDGQKVDSLLYSFDAQTNILTFKTELTGLISVKYAVFKIPPAYLYELAVDPKNPEQTVFKPRHKLFEYDSKITISGSKTFSVSVGNNENPSLEQSLFLKAEGYLNDDVQLQAQISDNQSPLTPEGDSKELSSLEKVFIRVFAKTWEIAFGDLEFKFSKNRFLRYTPVFNGAKAEYNNVYVGKIAAAESKGKSQKTTFSPLEGVAGPYYLGKNETIKIVAGSEEVFLNGIQLDRGDDYTIDYSEGSLNFNRFLAASDLVSINYQYSDENFRQNLYLASVGKNGDFFIFADVISQDDSNPVEGNFSAAEKQVLKNAGDTVPYADGAVLSSNGHYRKVEENGLTYYEYDDINGTYDVNFTYLGAGEGSYKILGIGRYLYVGAGQGSYEPLKKLIPPQQKTNLDLNTGYRSDNLDFYMEGLFSSFDQNTYSSLDDDDNNAVSAYSALNLKTEKADLNASVRYVNKNASFFAETDNPLEEYELIELTAPDSVTELNHELSVSYRPWEKLKLETGYNRGDYKNYGHSFKYRANANSDQNGYFPALKLNNTVGTADNVGKARVFLGDYSAQYDFTPYTLNSYYWQKYSKTEYATYATGYRNERFGAYAQRTSKTWSLKIQGEEYKNYSLTDTWSLLQTINNYNLYHQLNFTNHGLLASLSYKNVQGSSAQRLAMADVSSRHLFFNNALSVNTTYELQNQSFSERARELVYVGNNAGLYDSTGTYLPGGDYDYISAFLDEKELTTEVKASVKAFVNPSSYTKDSFWERWQSETYLLIEENSDSKKKEQVYFLLNLQNSHTVYGKILFRQIIWYNLIKELLNSRLTYEKTKSLDNKWQENDRDKQENKELELEYLALQNTQLTLTLTNNKETVSHYNSTIDFYGGSVEARQRLKDFTFTTKTNYEKETGKSVNSSGNYKLTAAEIAETVLWQPKKPFRFLVKGNYKRNYKKNTYLNGLESKRNGEVIGFSTQLTYKFNSYVNANANYSLNKYPQKSTEQLLKIEVSAEF